MAALGAQSIASSYEQLLHVDADGGGTTTTHVSVKDGDNGTTFALTLATDAVMITSTNRLEFGDTGTYIHQSADGVLDLVSDTEIELTATTIDINGAVDISGNITMADDTSIGISDSDERIEFDGAGDISVLGANLGVGTTTPTSTLIDGSATCLAISSANNYSILRFQNLNAGSTTLTEMGLASASGNFQIHVDSTIAMNIDDASSDISVSTGDLLFATAGKGICLGVTSNTDANTLDDYEEGTWTVAVTGSTSGSFVVTSGESTGSYTKIGRLVNIQGAIQIESESSCSGSIQFSLPVASGSGAHHSERNYGTAYLINGGGTIAGKTVTVNNGSSAVFVISIIADDGTAADLDNGDVDTSWFLGFSHQYWV